MHSDKATAKHRANMVYSDLLLGGPKMVVATFLVFMHLYLGLFYIDRQRVYWWKWSVEMCLRQGLCVFLVSADTIIRIPR